MRTYVVAVVVLIASVWSSPAVADDPQIYSDQDLIEAALEVCQVPEEKAAGAANLARALLSLEDAADAPEQYRGLILARACSEARFDASAVGDNGKAVGLMQFHGWVRSYGVDRLDPIESVRFHLERVRQMIPKVTAACGRQTEASAWLSAWVRSIRAPGKAKCQSRPLEIKVLARMHQIADARRRGVADGR